MRIITAILAALAISSTSATTLVTFDGGKSTTFTFTQLNDPVMGGKSTGTWNVADGYGVFDGDVVNVPSLQAPGFIKAAADGTFADVSADLSGSLVLRVRSTTPSYTGFRVAIAADTVSPAYACGGGGSLPFSRGCFKADFDVPAGSDFTDVSVPFTAFSDMWSPATGQHTKNCSSDASVCPTAKSLAGIKRIEVWAEGVAGKVHLEVQSVRTAAAAVEVLTVEESPAQPPKQYDQCSGAVQPSLRFNISTRESNMLPGEALAASVCCDSRLLAFAEPRFLFQAPDIQLYAAMDADGVTTFYDSVCGAPVFRAPVNRSLADFQADTNEHGWPSFRDEEVVYDNVMTNKTNGLVTSSCGTHLGSFLPDAKGSRWCIDLSCIAGNKA